MVSIGIVDYGMGNLSSIVRRLSMLDAKPFIVSTPQELVKADKLILPGVGHFGKAISNLKSCGIFESLNEAVLHKKTPVLGICLGMQLFANRSEEGDADGFGWVDTTVQKFRIHDKVKYKVPQTGWNTIHKCKESSLFKNIEDQSEFYFLHAYHYNALDPIYILAKTDYEYGFVSSIEKENIFGTQFHPEKSHDVGIQLLKNFILL